MRDFQGQLCFTNPVIMPLKILIVLAIVNCGMGRPGRRARGQAALRKEGWQVETGCQAGDSVSVGVELKGCDVVTCGVERVFLMMIRA